MNSNIHRVRSIKVDVDTKNAWMTIKVVDKDGAKSEITCFADKDDLEYLAFQTTFSGE
mgnify:CR=1 FL=1